MADPRFNTFFPVLILSIRTACQSEALLAFNIWDWVQSNSQLSQHSESTQYVFDLVFFVAVCLFAQKAGAICLIPITSDGLSGGQTRRL